MILLVKQLMTKILDNGKLTMQINFMSSLDTGDIRTMDSKSKNSKRNYDGY